MGISLPIGSKLDDAQARRVAQQAADYFAQSGRHAGDEFSRQLNQGIGKVDTGKARLQADQLQRAFDKAADAAGNLRREEEKLKAVQAAVNATDAQKITASERVEKARRAEARAVREVTNELRDMQDASRSAIQASEAMGAAAAKATMDFGELTTSVAAFAGPVGIGALAVGAATVGVGALGMLGGAVAELSGAIGALPGVIAGGVAAFGTLKLATLGFSDAIGDINDKKKFAEDLQKLSPNAQQAALAIQAMMPAFEGLKNAAQDSLFAGVGQELNKLTSVYLPSIQALTTSISSSFNQMFKGVADQLMTPETQAAMQSAMANIGQAFKNLVPAIGPVTRAVADLVNVSSSFLPGFANAIAGAATQFSNFLSNAAKSGELKRWIQDGVDAIKEFGRLLPDVKQLFLDFKANGKTAMSDLVTVTHGLLTVIDKLGGAYHNVSGEVKAMANLTVASFNLIGSSISAALEPMRALINVNNKVNPLFNLPQIPEFKGFDLPAPGAGINPFTPKVQGNAQAVPGAGTPYGSPSQIPGMGLATGKPDWWPTVSPVPAGGYAVPGVPDKEGKKGQLPTVPYGDKDPMSLLQGFPVTASLYSAAGTVLDNQQKVAQAQSDLNALQKANVRDEDAILAKRNELARAQREEHESELRLTEAKQQATKASMKSLQSTHDAMSQLGAGLDADLGISKGLSGIADNLVRFFGHLALAPLQGDLARQVDADPRKGGYGLMGILGAQGVFGQQFTGLPQQAQTGGSIPSFLSGGIPGGVNLANLPDAHGGHPQVAVLAAIARRFGLDLTAGKNDHAADGGFHPRGMAGDFSNSGGNSPQELAFANFMASNFGPYMQELIYSDPGFGSLIGGGKNVTGSGYYSSGTLADHQNHVHAAVTDEMAPAFMQRAQQLLGGGFGAGAQDATGALTGLAGAANAATQALAGGGSGFNWDAVAAKESSGNWQNADTGGNGHYGGLQFSPSTWNAFGGQQFAPMPNMATRDQQMAVADRTAFTGYNGTPPQGLGAWETITNGSTAGDGITVNSRPPVVGGGGMYPGMGMPQGMPGVGPGGIAPVGLGSAATFGPGQPGLGSSATLGGPAANPTQIGGGPGLSGSGSGIGMSGGGMMDMAMQAGAMGLDMLAPGAGQAAQTGIKLANRAIQFGGQAAGIGVQGLMDTFLPFGGSELASNNWFTKIVGGLAGAHPTIPNVAGKEAPKQPQPQPGADQGAGGAGGNTTNITVNNQRATEDGTGKDIAWHQQNAAMAPGM